MLRAVLACVAAIAAGCGGPGRDPLREAVLDVNAHVVVVKADSFGEYRDVVAKAATIDPAVRAAAPFAMAEVVVTSGGGRTAGVLLKGIDTGPGPLRDALERHVDEGQLVGGSATAAELPGVVLGRALARKLDVQLGDKVTFVLPLDPADQRGAPVTKQARLVGTMVFGVEDYDLGLAVTSMAAVQELVGKGDRATGVELWLARPGAAARIARRLGDALGEAYRVTDWCELNRAALRC